MRPVPRYRLDDLNCPPTSLQILGQQFSERSGNVGIFMETVS
jgi:hypothetical protein